MFRGEGLAARSSWLLEINFLRVLLGLLSERCSWPSAAGTGGVAPHQLQQKWGCVNVQREWERDCLFFFFFFEGVPPLLKLMPLC